MLLLLLLLLESSVHGCCLLGLQGVVHGLTAHHVRQAGGAASHQLSEQCRRQRAVSWELGSQRGCVGTQRWAEWWRGRRHSSVRQRGRRWFHAISRFGRRERSQRPHALHRSIPSVLRGVHLRPSFRTLSGRQGITNPLVPFLIRFSRSWSVPKAHARRAIAPCATTTCVSRWTILVAVCSSTWTLVAATPPFSDATCMC